MYGSDANRPPAGNGRSMVSSRTPRDRPDSDPGFLALTTSQTAAATTAAKPNATITLAERAETEAPGGRRSGSPVFSRAIEPDIPESQPAVSNPPRQCEGFRLRVQLPENNTTPSWGTRKSRPSPPNRRSESSES